MRNPLVSQHSHRQLHSFLDELKNGTQNYRTVSSLSQQVAQEYRGRCVIELLQNAHDAIREAPKDDPRCITFVMRTAPSPILLVANSGTPFRDEDFRGICQLGQSPKDPNKSVGNKGLGFRSVLEVSTCPEIWSSAATVGAAPLQFTFSTAVLRAIWQSLGELRRHGGEARSPFVPSLGLVDWSSDTLQRFLETLTADDDQYAEEVNTYLSPYQFPLDANLMPENVQSLLDAGHKTVIRLPIDGGRNGNPADAVQSVLDQFKAIDSYAMIFLLHVRTLTIDVDGITRTLTRAPSSDRTIFDQSTDYQRIEIRERLVAEGDASPKVFHLWQQTIGGDDDQVGREEIREAVRHLPNRWPEVRSATIGIATEDSDEPAQGMFVIFFPTTVETGTGAFINAPFFGTLDRRSINFDDAYNGLLWRYIVSLSLRVIRGLASELDDARRARAIIDLVGSKASVNGLGRRVLDDLLSTSVVRGCPLKDEAIVLCDGGWVTPRHARSMFAVSATSPVPEAVWTEHAQFAVVSNVLRQRRDGLNALADACGGSLDVLDNEMAETIGSVAAAIQETNLPITWQHFLESAVDILPARLRTVTAGIEDPLRSIKFLPTQSGQLLSAEDDAAFFFQPKRGAEGSGDFVGEVPSNIQRRVAFLHASVPTQEGPQGRNTVVQRFLDTRFAREFRRDDILRRVVEPAIPQLPLALDVPDASLCAELLAWSLKLIGNEPLQSVAATLRKLPVPCYGGWYPMGETTFGTGWVGRNGDALKELAEALPAAAGTALLSKVLLPPDMAAWSGTMPRHTETLVVGGVVDGLRLQLAEDTSWPATFVMRGHGQHNLPSTPAPGFSQETWDSWRNSVRKDATPHYEGEFLYRLCKVHVLPVLIHVGTLPPPASRALSELLLASFESWPAEWVTITCEKMEGWDWKKELESPLKYALRTLGWLADVDRLRPVGQRWYVREALMGPQRERFSHLYPLSVSMVRRLGGNSKLLAVLRQLGLKTFPMENERIGPQLLNALATAWDKKRIAPQRFDIFLGQVRDGWKHLDPTLGLPQRFIVSTGRRSLMTYAAAELDPVYLPDNAERVRTLNEHGKPMLEMRGEDAHRLGLTLCEATPVRRASRLKEQAVIDGVVWDNNRNDGEPLVTSRYAWIPPVLLAIAAYGGATATGAATKSWNEASERLRRARIVECERIKLDLRDGESLVASGAPAGLWLAGDVLAVCRGAESDYAQLAGAFQTSLDRLDLIRTLRLVLRELSGKNPPSNDEIELALSFAEIDAQSLADIRHRWSGSISLLVDRIRPVLAVLGVSEDGLENAQRDEEKLAEWLSTSVTQWNASDLIQSARRSGDDGTMGRLARETLGEVAELPRWNEALRSLGERYREVRNRDASEQTKSHLTDITPYVRALSRSVAKVEGRADRFLELERTLVAVTFPSDWADRWWQIPLPAVCSVIADAFVAAGIGEPSVAPLRGATSTEELRIRLLTEGVQVDVNPFDTAAENLRRLKAALAVLHDVYAIWKRTNSNADAVPMPDADSRLHPSAYVDSWDDATVLGHAFSLLDDSIFSAACVGCSRAEDVRLHLGLTSDAVEKRRQQRQIEDAEKARKKRTFVVAGGAFEFGKDDYSGLFDRLRTITSGDKGPDVMQDAFTSLTQPGQSRRLGGGGGGHGKSSHLRPSAEAREIGGIVGEILAYHLLRAKFGENVVTRDAWVSESRLKVLPPVPDEVETTSDGYGWDFFFRAKAKDWHVEVKATAGDDEEFEMGISEIEAASRLAGSKTKLWRILRVRHVLSATPEFDWLPNPFETEHRALFRMDRTGTRVSYLRKRG